MFFRAKKSLWRFRYFPAVSNMSLHKDFPASRSCSTDSQLLSQSKSKTQISLSDLLKGYGFPPSSTKTLVNKSEFASDSRGLDIKTALCLLESFKIPLDCIPTLVAEHPGIMEIEFLRKWETALRKIKDSNLDISSLAIKSIIQFSERFKVDPDDFVAKLRDFESLGFSPRGISMILERSPKAITVTKRDIQEKIEFFNGFGIPVSEFFHICYSFPEILLLGIENRLSPLLAEFEELGFSKEIIRKEIIREPQVLSMEQDELSRYLDLVKSLKCREAIKQKILKCGEFQAGFQTKKRIDCLSKHGMIKRDALKVLSKEPRVILYDVKEINEKVEFLVKTMGFDVECLLDVPQYLGVNFRKQIVPRYRVMEHLQARGAFGTGISLKSIINLTTNKFHNLYVKPHLECKDLFARTQFDGFHVPIGREE